mgnify:FL=1
MAATYNYDAIQIAPWFLNQIQHTVERNVQTDPKTGKQFMVKQDRNGRMIHIPVNATYDADDPIRDMEDVRRLGNYIKTRKGRKNVILRDYAYYVFSINMWRRAGDTLKLRICDVANTDGSIKTHLLIKEEKTGKVTKTIMNDAVRNVLRDYLNEYKYNTITDYLFPNFNPKYDEAGNEMPLEVQAMRRMLQRAATAIGLTGIHMGTHTLRKTGAYHAAKYANTQAELNMIADILGHSSFKITQRYIKEDERTRDNFMERCGINI